MNYLNSEMFANMGHLDPTLSRTIWCGPNISAIVLDMTKYQVPLA